jgi:hypothetical protein
MFTLKTELKSFQKKTVSWLINQEELHSGGLLLSDAGTGKSISIISLLQKQLKNNEKVLIVCPSSLIKNWKNEFLIHTNLNVDLDILEYHGPQRETLLKNTKANIIITSYNIIERDHAKTTKKFTSDIFKMNFKRIILDESHYVRNTKTKVFQSIMRLIGEYKWVLSATPIFNSSDDMYAYFKFLFDDVESLKEWKIIYNKKDLVCVKNLNAKIKEHSLSFKKKDILKELPKKQILDINIEFSEEERLFYEAFKTYSEQRVKKLNITKKYLKNMGSTCFDVIQNNTLVHLLRLRQSCNSIQLLNMPRLQKAKNLIEATELLHFYNTQAFLKEECPICYDNQATHIANPCGHKCCKQCWDKINSKTCPMCRSNIHEIENIEDTQEKITNISTKKSTDDTIFGSSKLLKIKELVNDIIQKNEKIVIVSQWVGMIKLVQKYLEIESVVIDGNVPLNQRFKNIKNFQSNPDIKICFISLMACAEGINLTAANHVILIDNWYNKSKMIQVSERVNRIGQEKLVYIYKLSIKNSIEQKITKYVNNKYILSGIVLNKWSDNNEYLFVENNNTSTILNEDEDDVNLNEQQDISVSEEF